MDMALMIGNLIGSLHAKTKMKDAVIRFYNVTNVIHIDIYACTCIHICIYLLNSLYIVSVYPSYLLVLRKILK